MSWPLRDDASLAPLDDASAKQPWAMEPPDLLLDPMPPSAEAPGLPRDERLGRLPPNEVLRYDIRQIIAASDLTSITKRQVRAQLQDLYGCPIQEKKAYINAQIEAALRDL